ncbi:MAG: hypothetical protein GY874_03750 [Desulfobacteraceae bacterium]|nr:hypothetical protein [Desulfobacteraceae bacterium]
MEKFPNTNTELKYYNTSARDKNLKENHHFRVWQLDCGAQIYTTGAQGQNLLITAHGAKVPFFGACLGDAKVHQDQRLAFYQPDNYALEDPGIQKIIDFSFKNEILPYATVKADGIERNSIASKDERVTEEQITGSAKKGYVANYVLSHFEDDSEEVVLAAMIKNRKRVTQIKNIVLNAEGGDRVNKAAGKPVYNMSNLRLRTYTEARRVNNKTYDVLTFNNTTTLHRLLSELHTKGVKYDDICCSFCRLNGKSKTILELDTALQYATPSWLYQNGLESIYSHNAEHNKVPASLQNLSAAQLRQNAENATEANLYVRHNYEMD